MNGPRDHARMLLRKAANDLIAADATPRTGQAHDTVCFHAQQAAEKSLKALLAAHDVCYPWTHDLLELLALVVPRWPAVADLSDEVEGLTLYAVTIRHDESEDPTPDDAQAAFRVASLLQGLAERLVTDASDADSLPRGDDSRT